MNVGRRGSLAGSVSRRRDLAEKGSDAGVAASEYGTQDTARVIQSLDAEINRFRSDASLGQISVYLDHHRVRTASKDQNVGRDTIEVCCDLTELA